MTDTGDYTRMDVDSLAQQCKSETEKFFRRLAYDAYYCFELLSRAFRDQQEDALGQVYAIYLPILTARARRHSNFHQSCQDATAFARTALSNFYHAVKGEQFLKKFSTLPEAMGYLYTCLGSEILQDIRKNQRIIPLDDVSPSEMQKSSLEGKELWAHICSLLPDKSDQDLAYWRLVLDMKPAEIVQRYGATTPWKTERMVSVNVYRIREVLRNDPYLRDLGGFGKTQDDGDQ